MAPVAALLFIEPVGVLLVPLPVLGLWVRNFTVGAAVVLPTFVRIALDGTRFGLGAELGVENVVCILDQNMNYLDGDVYGTDLCRRLRGEFAWSTASTSAPASSNIATASLDFHAAA